MSNPMTASETPPNSSQTPQKGLPPKASPNFALRTLGPGGIGGGLTWWALSIVPETWVGPVGAVASLLTAILATITPYLERKAVEKIKKWWLKRQLRKSIRECERIIRDPETPPELRAQARIALQRLRTAEYRVILSEAVDTEKATWEITGRLPHEIIKEVTDKAEALKQKKETPKTQGVQASGILKR